MYVEREGVKGNVFGNRDASDVAKGDSPHRGREPSRKEPVPQRREEFCVTWGAAHSVTTPCHLGSLGTACLSRAAQTMLHGAASSTHGEDGSGQESPGRRSQFRGHTKDQVSTWRKCVGVSDVKRNASVSQLFSQLGQRPQIHNQMETNRPSPPVCPQPVPRGGKHHVCTPSPP